MRTILRLGLVQLLALAAWGPGLAQGVRTSAVAGTALAIDAEPLAGATATKAAGERSTREALAAAVASVQGREAPGCRPAGPSRAVRSSVVAPESWVTLRTLTDPANPAAHDFSDILSARVEQEGGQLRFVMTVRGAIPTTLPLSTDSITYLWLVDADRDGDTGQPHGGVGSEFNVRAVVSETWGGGFVDVTGELPGGGLGTVSIDGNQISITVGLNQIAAPVSFDWRCSTFETIDGVPTGGNGGETSIATATPLPPPPVPTEVRALPPLLMLSPAGPASGQMTAELFDAPGHSLPVEDYHLQFFGPADAGVASVDGDGVVTVHSVPTAFSETPYLLLTADGVGASNATVVRSTATDLGVGHRYYSGDRVTYFLPESLEGVDLDAITEAYDVVRASKVAYKLQEVAVGGRPFAGGEQFLVLDVTDDPATVPCGLSGNPVRLGWTYGVPVHNSCYIVNDPSHRVPQFFVIFHEVGHNFSWASAGFAQLMAAVPDAFDYSEGCASLLGMWSAWGLEACAGAVGATGAAEISSQFASLKSQFLSDLAAYRAAGADYDEIDPNILDGIFFDLLDRFGPESWFDFFSLFAPIDQALPCTASGADQQATLIAAAFSASAGEDLRWLFASEYGFPIDDAAWPALLACAQQAVSRRTFDLEAICAAALSGPELVCTPDANTGCLLEGRFQVEVDWSTGNGSGEGRVMPFGGERAESDQSVFFYFFNPENFEMGVKMVDACSFNDSFWIFASGLTNVGYTISILDTFTGQSRQVSNPLGSYPRTVGLTDGIGGFDCTPGAGAQAPAPALDPVRPPVLNRPDDRSGEAQVGSATPQTGACVEDADTACHLSNRFRVEVQWATSEGTGTAQVMSFGGQRASSDQSSFWWFFNADNFEMGVKMVDACVEPFHAYWVFVSGLTNQAYDVTVTDTVTSDVRHFTNPLGSYPQTIGATEPDTGFPCF